jgi:hypothetical protein
VSSDLELPWNELILVCKDCRKRSRGPDAKAKEIAAAIKKQVGATRPRPRVVLSSCLGLCPKKATAVVVSRAGQPHRAMGVGTVAEIADRDTLSDG